jgi:hypothetical protein
LNLIVASAPPAFKRWTLKSYKNEHLPSYHLPKELSEKQDFLAQTRHQQLMEFNATGDSSVNTAGWTLTGYRHFGYLVKLFDGHKNPEAGTSAVETSSSGTATLRTKTKMEQCQRDFDSFIERLGETDLERKLRDGAESIKEEIAKDIDVYNNEGWFNKFKRYARKLHVRDSHCPLTYQQSLINARFYFENYPGVPFEKLQGRWAQKKTEGGKIQWQEAIDMPSDDEPLH